MYLQVYTSTVYFCQNFKLTQENQLNILEIRKRLLWWEPQKSVYNGTKNFKKKRMAEEMKILTKIHIRF